MDRERWDRIQALFHESVDVPESEWLSHLKNAEPDDTVVDQVLALLREDFDGTLLDRGIAQMSSDVLDATPGQHKQFGPYRIIRILGEGGMGTVYLAERDDLKNKVALKVLRDAWLSPSRRERFLSEQRLLGQLTHASIARLYDADTLPDGTPWFVMEYVDGHSPHGLLPHPSCRTANSAFPVSLRSSAVRTRSRRYSSRPETIEHSREAGWRRSGCLISELPNSWRAWILPSIRR